MITTFNTQTNTCFSCGMNISDNNNNRSQVNNGRKNRVLNRCYSSLNFKINTRDSMFNQLSSYMESNGYKVNVDVQLSIGNYLSQLEFGNAKEYDLIHGLNVKYLSNG